MSRETGFITRETGIKNRVMIFKNRFLGFISRVIFSITCMFSGVFGQYTCCSQYFHIFLRAKSKVIPASVAHAIIT
jgi:hypothetical protein